ncbi:transposase [Chryseobacterium sp. Leaf201]|uniref:transposase n=1 Tax=Chryseobacterium sp. Leaf201 TaxID=1735672 RepID=UPI000AA55600|nr:transposase [Chryseobacterium sp. Leaf201]
MPQSLVKNYVHIIFSTKYRNDFIDENIEEELYAYISSLCKKSESPALPIGGIDHHIHILCLLSEKLP